MNEDLSMGTPDRGQHRDGLTKSWERGQLPSGTVGL